MKTLYEAYQDVYYDEDNFYNDAVEFCEELNIFESLEESEYFVNSLIENDLAITFVEDVLEYYDQEQLLDEEYISEVSAGLLKAGLKAAGGVFKKVTPAVRGLSARTLAKQGYTPGGFGKGGKQLTSTARATQARAARTARAERKPPSPEKPNKYLDMLTQKRSAQASTPAPSSAKPKTRGMTPSYVAKRGVTDTLATTLALGMGHMAGIKPATNILRQMTTPIVRSIGTVTQRTAPTARRASGAAADPWMQFMKGSKPKQLGLPKEGPSSRLPGRFLPKPSSGPKGLLSPAKNTAGKSMASSNTQSLAKMPKGTPKSSGTVSQPEFGSVGKLMARSNSQNIGKMPKGASKPSGGIKQPTFGGAKSSSPNRRTSSIDRSPFRATGPSGGNPTIERLASQAAKPQRGVPRKANIGAAAATAAGTGAILGADQMNKKRQQQYNVYNTKDPSGKVRSRLKVGPKVVGPKIVGGAVLGPAKDFEDAFRKNREAGKKTFKYGSGEYTTQLAKEHYYSDLVNLVLSEGYATNVKSAQEIVNSMSDEWLASILSEE